MAGSVTPPKYSSSCCSFFLFRGIVLIVIEKEFFTICSKLRGR